jgi:hypothetical protein
MIVEIFGQQLEIPDGLSDEQVRALFAPFYPDIAHANLKRQGDRLQVIKQAGTKGCHAALAKALKEAPAYLNPALSLSLRLRQQEIEGHLSLEMLLPLQEALETAITQSQQESQLVGKIAGKLAAAPAIPSAYPTFI